MRKKNLSAYTTGISNLDSRSNNYQYKIMELPWHDNYAILFTNANSIQAKLNPFHYNEDVLNLQDKLINRFYKIVNQVCTDKQLQILCLFLDGYTQTEISNTLRINQSSVQKTLHGSPPTKEVLAKLKKIHAPHMKYGGILPKLKKAVLQDKIIISLLLEINELQDQIL